MRFLLFNALVVVALFHLFAGSESNLHERADALINHVQAAADRALDRAATGGDTPDHGAATANARPSEPADGTSREPATDRDADRGETTAQTRAAPADAASGSTPAEPEMRSASDGAVDTTASKRTGGPSGSADESRRAAATDTPNARAAEATSSGSTTPATTGEPAGEPGKSGERDGPDRTALRDEKGEPDTTGATEPADGPVRHADAANSAGQATADAGESTGPTARPDRATAPTSARDAGQNPEARADTRAPGTDREGVALTRGDKLMSRKQRRKELFNLAQEMEMMFVDQLED